MGRDKRLFLVRAAAILTNAYVAGTVVETKDVDNQLILYIDFTKGSLTTAELKVEFSNDGTSYYQESAKSTTGGVESDQVVEHQLSATGALRLAIPIMDRYIKVSVIGTGTVTSSSMTVKALIGSV